MARLHHIALRTPDVDRAFAFYQHWFGLRPARDMRPRAVWLSLEGGVLMIEQSDPDEPAVPAGSRELLALAVTVEERDRLREKLVQAGLLEDETAHTLYFRDPDGRRVAVSSYPL